MTTKTSGQKRSKGQLIASALSGAWRDVPPPLTLSESELRQITPALLRSGSGALVWWKASRTNSELRDALGEFLIAYQVQILRAAIHELNVHKVFRELRENGLDAMLVKGWAVARHYPNHCLRPYGDLDICVREEQYERAARVLKQSATRNVWVDLHRGFATLDGESEDSLFECAMAAPARGFLVKVPAAEDHLRMLCLHMLRHGVSRPVWLCDVALLLETRKRDFDWPRFYGRDPRHRQWLRCVIGLAHELLRMRVDEALKDEYARAPRWLVRAVERRWARWFEAEHRDQALRSLLDYRFEPATALEDFYFRFDPLRATVEVNGSFNKMPRLPYQLAALTRRLPELPGRITDLLQGLRRKNNFTNRYLN